MVMKLESLRLKRLAARSVLERIKGLPFKSESSAKWVSVHRSWTGVITVKIEHDNLQGCTPEMIRWWFENLGRTTTWNGQDMSGPEVSFYHLWHHRDHIAVTPLTEGNDGRKNKGFVTGGISMIEERFNDHHEKIRAVVKTEVLDDREFTFTIRRFGLTVGRIVHLYAPVPGGSSFYAETKIGVSIPIVGWLLSWIASTFVYSPKTAEHWIKHNIEETGRSEQIVPMLYQLHSQDLGARD